MPPEHSDQARWFSTYVLPHEPALRAWLCRRFPDADNTDDIIQDSYLRLLKARESEAICSPKAFLFRTARNLSLDYLKSHKVSRKVPFEDLGSSNVLDPGAPIPDVVSRNQELEILKAAIQSLPDRCRQIVTLHEVYGMAQKDVARRLGISASTVSDQLTIGLRKCTAFAKRYKREGESL